MGLILWPKLRNKDNMLLWYKSKGMDGIFSMSQDLFSVLPELSKR